MNESLPTEEYFEPRLLKPADPESGYHFEWWETEEGKAVPIYHDLETGEEIEIAWAPLPGSQFAFLQAWEYGIFEVLYEGTRGPGKTDTLLMDFLQHVGKGYGPEWVGVLFRQTYPQLDDVISKTRKWFRLFFPQAKYNKVEHCWTFPQGERLLLRHMMDPDDYWNYHGHAYPWIGWEELCNWADDKCYLTMQSCCRSTVPGMPRCYRATTNPYGPGHNWVKSRWKLPLSRGRVIKGLVDDKGDSLPTRLAIHGHIKENIVLLTADPDYLPRIRAAARNPAEAEAWLEGSWDITAGGMFDDIWRRKYHVVPGFPLAFVPTGWKIDRSFDWGSSKPFAVCWWIESNGEPFEWEGRMYGTVKGDLYIVREWYGWTGTRNEGVRMSAHEIAEGIKDYEDDFGLRGRVKPGPADSAIFDVDNDKCVATDMKRAGVRWLAADKGPGSRKQGWEKCRDMMKAAYPSKSGGPREKPGMFIFECCEQTLETFPSLPRDDKDLDDVNTNAEDHLGDAIRYRVRNRLRAVKQEDM